MQVKSAFATGIKGFIYVEAYKKSQVERSIAGIRSLSWKEPKLIPINEMVDTLTIKKSKTILMKYQWVRVKRGLYKNDIAQVSDRGSTENSFLLKLVPRIDYTQPRGALKSPKAVPVKRKAKKRPPQQLFDADALKDMGGDVRHDGYYWKFEGKQFDPQGLVIIRSNRNLSKFGIKNMVQFSLASSANISEERACIALV